MPKHTNRKIVQVTRLQSFAAAHRLHSPHLTDEENRSIFGKCNHPNGHGHNFKAEVTLRGPVDQKTGMLCDIQELKNWIQVAIMDTMDHKNIDMDVEWFKSNVSTMENIAIFIWGGLQEAMGGRSGLLYSVKVWETENHFAVYFGEEMT